MGNSTREISTSVGVSTKLTLITQLFDTFSSILDNKIDHLGMLNNTLEESPWNYHVGYSQLICNINHFTNFQMFLDSMEMLVVEYLDEV